MICEKCNQYYDDSITICPYCGHVKENRLIICKNCGCPFSAEYEVCPQCGTIVEAEAEVNENPFADKQEPITEEIESSDASAVTTSEDEILPTKLYCEKCNKTFPSTKKFCRYCGTPLVACDSHQMVDSEHHSETHDTGHAKTDSEKKNYCPSCGKEYPIGKKFCRVCGTPLQEGIKETTASVSATSNDDYQARTSVIPSRQQVETTTTYPQSQTDTDAEQRIPVTTSAKTMVSANAEDGFFALCEILLDEKVSFMRFANSYKVYDLSGNIIGAVEQTNISGGAKAARLLLGSGTKSMQQFHYNIVDSNGKQLAGVNRDGGAFAQIRITDRHEKTLGYLSRGQLLDTNQNVICRLKSDWKGWNLSITDASGHEIGTVQKRWNGISKEFFTSADKYHISIDPSIEGANRVAVFGLAIVYDILIHER